MKNNNLKKYILILIIAIILIISLGTYAWLTYRTNDTAMVLTVGNINNVKITLSPYQINGKISPNLTYTEEPYTEVEVINNSTSPRNIKLFYTINAIDSELATSDFKYTIEKKEVGSNSYTHITPDGNFNGVSKGDTITIIDEYVPVGTTYYKVYVWLYSASSSQNDIPGKKFNAELNAEISTLPKVYQQVEYIESTGTQYINSNVSQSDVYGYNISFESTGIRHSENEYELDGIFGVNNSKVDSEVRDTKIWFGYDTTNNTGKTGFYLRGKGKNTSKISLNSYYQKHNGLVFNNEVNQDDISYGTLEGTNNTVSNQEIYIFAVNCILNNGNSRGAGFFSKTKIYYLKFYGENNVLIHDYIPCYRIVDGAIGLYDMVDGTFLTKSGTGEFLVGPNVEQVGDKYLVRFDPNGGTLDTLTTIVTLGETYGNLPTPNRDGYTFLGWNGKNLFDKSNIDNAHFIITRNGELSNLTGAGNLDDYATSNMIPVKPNTTYIKSGTIGARTQDCFDDSGNFIQVENFSSGERFTTPNNCYFLKFNLLRTNSPYNDIQLEEGSNVTAYEPYLINGNTIVTQDRNHTLTAIWQVNS